MTPQAWQSLAVLFGTVFAAVAGLVAYDVVMMAKYGNTATISHGMFVLGTKFPLFVAFVMLLVGLVVGGLVVHFWG